MPTFRYRALSSSWRGRQRLDRGADRGRGRTAHRISRADPHRLGHRGKRCADQAWRWFCAVFAAAPGGRHHLHRRSRLAAAHRRQNQRGAGVARGRLRYWPHAVDGDESDVGNSRRRELRRRNFAPSECFSPDLCRARARGRGVGEFGADPRGDKRGAPARRGACVGVCPTLCDTRRSCCWRPAACCYSSSSSFCRNSPTCFATLTQNWIRFLSPFSAFPISCART